MAAPRRPPCITRRRKGKPGAIRLARTISRHVPSAEQLLFPTMTPPSVRRSARLFEQWQESYGPRFEYHEFARFTGPLAAAKAWRATVTLGVLGLMLRWQAGRTLAAKLAPSPGEGPSEVAMNAGWFRAEFVGFTEDGQTVNGLIAGLGDPGNRSTVRMVCESALALALNEAELPGFPARGGVLTPATALGDVLARRLRSAGITIRVPDVPAGR